MQILIPLISSMYFVAAFFIFAFSMVQLSLIIYFLLQQRKKTAEPLPVPQDKLPTVTVQLPLYNERYVAKRLIDCVAQIDYPKHLLDIQVLDDSTDDTQQVVAERVDYWRQQGINIEQILRPNRSGYKAGALAYGLTKSTSEYVAIFDADFLPPTDFLRRTLSHFQNEWVGMVQTRWGHINESYSLLTKLQAFGLNGHFIIEQTGRNAAGSFINFNGTGGVWRRKCIEDAGGWSADTLTEDLDLSFRAQMKGWRFHYLPEIVTPAELPVIMSAIKSQQYRWNKGGAETARKHLLSVLLHRAIPLQAKLHGFFHLISSSVFLGLFISTFLSVPILLLKETFPGLQFIMQVGALFTGGFFSIGLLYWLSARHSGISGRPFYYLKTFPLFIALCMGLSLHNSIAVLEGWLGIKSPFVRTPKFNIQQQDESWAGNVYVRSALTPGILIEGLLSIYFFTGFVLSIALQEYLFSIFIFLPTLGFLVVFLYSLQGSKQQLAA
ncbi:MAG: glycosyltransferase family 2 protein [Sumerlaeia bacterium]